jgi:hypothetical protein
MTGYKSKVAMSTGVFYAPHVPDTKPLTWQERLRKTEARAREKYGYGNNLDVVSDCMDYMQLHFPGNYVLLWQKTESNEYHLVPNFADPKHETMWKLKWA